MPSRKALRRARRMRALTRPAIAVAAATAIVALTGGAAFAAQTQSEVTATSLSAMSENARKTLHDAREAVGAATKTTTEAEASGLDLGGADTKVDTSALRDEIERLSTLDVLPVFLLTDVVAETRAETARVGHETFLVHSALATAQARKAAEEAAARAAAEAA
ncbi:phospholipase, partial [Microbacterium ulmi]|nr:phospholipase [Microbacterium ulmi]